MIRKLKKADINRVTDLWLDTNLKVHEFIPFQYWKNNYDAVKEMLPQAEVYAYENDNKIQGFVGLNDEYIETLLISAFFNFLIILIIFYEPAQRFL